jgi:hypothetical protein
MLLPPAGREYATWTVTDPPTGITLEVSFDAGATWATLTAVDATTHRVLVAGPSATSNPVGTVVLAEGRNTPLIRAVDNPEVVIRDGGTIDVK